MSYVPRLHSERLPNATRKCFSIAFGDRPSRRNNVVNSGSAAQAQGTRTAGSTPESTGKTFFSSAYTDNPLTGKKPPVSHFRILFMQTGYKKQSDFSGGEWVIIQSGFESKH